MRIDRGRNFKLGVIYGWINQCILLVLPFFIQTYIIQYLGTDYSGLRGLFNSIITILSISELGVGTAIVYSMYKPIACDDYLLIGALLNIYKKAYKFIGVVVFLIGLAIIPFLDYLIKDDFSSDINIQLAFLICLIDSVVSYVFMSYKSSLLVAYQRTDVISKSSSIVHIFRFVFQTYSIIVLRNFYAFWIVSIMCTAINNLIISNCVDRMFPSIVCVGEVSQESKKEIRTNTIGLLIGRICGVTRNAFDSVFISMFLGLLMETIYCNYFLIITSLSRFMLIIVSSLSGGIGNSVARNTKEKNYEDMVFFEFAYLMLSGWVTICLLCLFQPFMEAWVGDKLVLSNSVMILFPLYFYIGKMGDIRGMYSDAAGLFWKHRFRTISEAISNILLNYFLVVKYGLSGIMMATIITMILFGFLWSTEIVFKNYFKMKVYKYIFRQFIYVAVTFIIAIVTWLISSMIHLGILGDIIYRAIVCITIVPFLYWLVYHKNAEFAKLIKYIKLMLISKD